MTAAARPLWRVLTAWPSAAAAFLRSAGAGVKRRRQGPCPTPRLAPLVIDPASIAAGQVDIELALRVVLQALEPEAVARGCRLEIALQPGLRIRAEIAGLKDAVSLVARDALQRAAGGRVLVTAGRSGGSLQITAVDDGPPADPEIIEGALRPAAEICARAGGALELDSFPGRGTKIRLRFPDPAQGRPAPEQAVAAAPIRAD